LDASKNEQAEFFSEGNLEFRIIYIIIGYLTYLKRGCGYASIDLNIQGFFIFIRVGNR
jgi:hypothetical protein